MLLGQQRLSVREIENWIAQWHQWSTLVTMMSLPLEGTGGHSWTGIYSRGRAFVDELLAMKCERRLILIYRGCSLSIGIANITRSRRRCVSNSRLREATCFRLMILISQK